MLPLIFSLQLLLGAEPLRPDPLIGSWEGVWNLPRGMSEEEGHFRLRVWQGRKGLKGSMLETAFVEVEIVLNDQDEPSRRTTHHLTNRKVPLRAIKTFPASPSRYRFEADGTCWNATLTQDRLEGMWNGGPCTVMGVGIGARLISFTATRTAGR